MSQEYRKPRKHEREYVLEIQKKNLMCQGNHCQELTLDNQSEVRLMPSVSGYDKYVMCLPCFNYEMAWRAQQNRVRPLSVNFAILEWSDLEVYT
jgi:hypothetical protein